MPTIQTLFQHLDADGRYRDGDGTVDVVFVTGGGVHREGQMHFTNGLCTGLTMEGGGDWSSPDYSPLNNVRLILHAEGATPQHVGITEGRVLRLSGTDKRSAKSEFLTNLRVARNLFYHQPNQSDDRAGNLSPLTKAVIRAAIWLTPKSLSGFDSSYFPELRQDTCRELESAVRDFLDIARKVPSNQPATDDQYTHGVNAFTRILNVLSPYIPSTDETRQIASLLKKVDFPSWVVNWDYELGSDTEGTPAMWVNVYVDESQPWLPHFGQFAFRLTTRIRELLAESDVPRVPYVRVRTAIEHKSEV